MHVAAKRSDIVRWHPEWPDPRGIRAPGRRGPHTTQPTQGPFHRPPLRSSHDWIEQTSLPLDAALRLPPLRGPGHPAQQWPDLPLLNH
ncbi:hypothetical protein CBM2606_A110082 [Cupriavidus taiwanensis]|nr:hypothetical protein CBM2606_A110082 [Cupriavidus taiwanensis]